MENADVPYTKPIVSHAVPPLRYFVGCILMAAISVFLERDAHISSGGVSGLSIGIADVMHISVGLANLSIKLLIFLTVLVFSGKTTALWTCVGAIMTGASMFLFERIPLDLDWPRWFAFIIILLFAKFPIGLLASRGYSTGGFTAVAQVLLLRKRIPLWLSLLLLNLLSVVVMYLAHGPISGLLTGVISVTSGVMVEVWSKVTRETLDEKRFRYSL